MWFLIWQGKIKFWLEIFSFSVALEKKFVKNKEAEKFFFSRKSNIIQSFMEKRMNKDSYRTFYLWQKPRKLYIFLNNLYQIIMTLKGWCELLMPINEKNLHKKIFKIYTNRRTNCRNYKIDLPIFFLQWMFVSSMVILRWRFSQVYIYQKDGNLNLKPSHHRNVINFGQYFVKCWYHIKIHGIKINKQAFLGSLYKTKGIIHPSKKNKYLHK